MNRPFFSIITCTFNSEKYIEQNINSVMDQSFQNFEHIIIDGLSNDSTISIIEKKSINKNLKVYFSEPKGISNALNLGVKKSSGKYIIHLNSDDYFYSNSVLQNVQEFIVKNGYPEVIYGKIQTIEDDNTSIGIFPRQKILQNSNYTLLKYINFVPHQAVFIQNEVFIKHGLFDENLTSNMDYDLWLRIMNKTNWLFIDTIISNYRVRINAESTDRRNYTKNQSNLLVVLKRHLSPIEFFLSRISNYLLSKLNTVYR